MRPLFTKYYPACVIEPFEECPVAQATNEILNYTYKIPGVGYVYRYGNNGGGWTEGPLYFRRDRHADDEVACLGEIMRRTPNDILEEIMPTYIKMAKIIGS